MEYYLVIYKVTLDHVKTHYGKAGVASNDFFSDWETIKQKIFKGYRITFPGARHMRVEAVKTTKISFQKYNALVSIATNMHN